MPGKYQKLAGKHVLVIGGTSGIGFSVAEASIESGASVTLSSSSPQRVASSIERLRADYPEATISGYPCDLSRPTVEADIEKLFEQFGKVDHIVFTAGDALALGPLANVTLESLHQAGQVRFFAAMLLAKIAVKYLNPGPQASITYTMGIKGERPAPGWAAVSSFSAGMHGMTKALAIELSPIRVNSVCLGSVDTELWSSFPEEVTKKLIGEAAENNLTKHMGKPEEVAEAYLWLMKDSNATGVVASTESGSLIV